MNTISRSVAALGLAALAFGTLAAAPANAKAPAFIRHAQQHQATRLDRQARHAAYNGNYRRASRLRHQAAHLRTAARHGH